MEESHYLCFDSSVCDNALAWGREDVIPLGPQVLLSVWGQEIFFCCIFIFMPQVVSKLKGVVESSLLFEDESLTPNIDEVMAV